MALRLGTCLLLSLLAGCTRPPAGLQIVRSQKLELRESAQGVLVGAGDIASCGSRSDDATGALVVDVVNLALRGYDGRDHGRGGDRVPRPAAAPIR